MKITSHELSQMTLTELTNLNQLVLAVLKAKRGLEGAQIATQLRVKQEVTINHSSHVGTVFIVDKINKSRAVCSVKGNPMKSYNVPFPLINPVK